MLYPSYLSLFDNGELRQRIERSLMMLWERTSSGQLLGVDLADGDEELCQTGTHAMVYGSSPKFGEEEPLVGKDGSGTIFFAQSSLPTQYLDHKEPGIVSDGYVASPEDLAAMMIDLQEDGCHNVQLVSASHVVPVILQGLEIAIDHGFRLPLVYNSAGYDQPETLAVLDGIIDIYLPEIRYADKHVAFMLTEIHNYPEVAQAAVRIMHQQVGDLNVNRQGLAAKGLMVRHTVLPNGLAGTGEVASFLASISKNTYLHVMDSYVPPVDRRTVHPDLARRTTPEEVDTAMREVHAAGLHRLRRRTTSWS